METIITAIVTFILGYIAGIWLPLKFRKEDKTPKISIGPFQQSQNYFDITNHGGDILNLKIKIFWLQDGVRQQREMNNFFNSNEDPLFGHPHNSNSLKKSETKKIINCPSYSDDGKVEVAIQGEDVSGQIYKEQLILENNFIFNARSS